MNSFLTLSATNKKMNKEKAMYFDATVQLISLALDASLMRETAIANNITNINTENYQTMEVNFEQQVNDSINLNNSESVNLMNPFYQLSNHQSTIDEQMALNVQNITHYRALIKGLNQKLAIMKLALAGNNQ